MIWKKFLHYEQATLKCLMLRYFLSYHLSFKSYPENLDLDQEDLLSKDNRHISARLGPKLFDVKIMNVPAFASQV